MALQVGRRAVRFVVLPGVTKGIRALGTIPTSRAKQGFLILSLRRNRCAQSTPLGMIIFWTGKASYISAFLGIPYVYNYTQIGNNCTPWSPQSIAQTATMVLWFSEQGLFSNGAYIMPLPCTVRPWVDDDIDIINVRDQACAVHVANFNEFWWFSRRPPPAVLTTPGQ